MNFNIVRNTNGTIGWSEDQLKYIVDEYEDGKSLTSIGKKFGTSYKNIGNLLKRNGVKTLGNKQGFPRKEHYFDEINTPDKAYWLGIMYADGNVSQFNNEISLRLKDEEHIYKFKEALGATNHKVIEHIDKRFESLPKIYIFAIKDRQLKNSLIKWGCTPKKSLTIKDLPNIPRKLTSHFLRGYFDGDGSLHWLKGTKNFRISFVGTKDFLEELKKELGATVSIQQHKGNQSCYLQIAGRQQVPRILNYLYKDSKESIRLDRKYNLYKECLLWAHRH